MKKYNRSAIARRANALARTMNRSAAWKIAWAEAKAEQLKEQEFILKMKDRWTQEDFVQKARLNSAIWEAYSRIADLKKLAAQANVIPLGTRAEALPLAA